MYLGILEAGRQEEVSSIQPGKFPLPKSNGRAIYYQEIPYKWDVFVKTSSAQTAKETRKEEN
jgi:hypothetical protein